MDDQQRDDDVGKLAAADETEAYADKAADGELSDDELTDATGGRKSYAKKPDEDAGPDGRIGLV